MYPVSNYSAREWRNLLFGTATDVILTVDDDIGSPVPLRDIQPALRLILRGYLPIIERMNMDDDRTPNSLFSELPGRLHAQLTQTIGRNEADAFFQWTTFVWKDWNDAREWFSYSWVLSHWARTKPPALGSFLQPLMAIFREVVYDRVDSSSRFLHRLKEQDLTPWDRVCVDLGGFQVEMKDPEHRTSFSGWCREGIELSRLQLFWPKLLSSLRVDEQQALQTAVWEVVSRHLHCPAGWSLPLPRELTPRLWPE